MNQIVIMGRLTADPERRETTNGTQVARFTVAVQRDFSKDETDFLPVVVWKKTAEFVSRYFTKGQMIALIGRLQANNYTDKQGNKRTAFEIVADRVYFAGNNKQKDSNTNTGAQGVDIGDLSDYVEIGEGKLPF